MKFLINTAIVIFVFMHVSAHAEIRLASDWSDDFDPKVPKEQRQGERLEKAALATANQLNAANVAGPRGQPTQTSGFQLYFGDTKYYIQPMLFMAKDKPNEVCTPEDYQKAPTYKCVEGQRYKASCHLLFFNAQFQNVGVHRIRVNEPYEYFCNATPAMGVLDRNRNELLVTIQYFPIDGKVAGKAGDIGSGWKRMTTLFRLKETDGKISVEQDDSCLKNPNSIETIPDARKALKACATTQSAHP
jgi:hypothetical protein